MYNNAAADYSAAPSAGFVGVAEEDEFQNNYQTPGQQSYSAFAPAQGYPVAQTVSQMPPMTTGNAFAFDNVDISGNGRSGAFDSTPFGRVHEFVSVSNRVSLVVPLLLLRSCFTISFQHFDRHSKNSWTQPLRILDYVGPHLDSCC